MVLVQLKYFRQEVKEEWDNIMSWFPVKKIVVQIARSCPVNDCNHYIFFMTTSQNGWKRVLLKTRKLLQKPRLGFTILPVEFGVPLELYFKSSIYLEVFKILRIRKASTTLLHSQSDCMIERFNQTLEQYLLNVVSKHQNN